MVWNKSIDFNRFQTIICVTFFRPDVIVSVEIATENMAQEMKEIVRVDVPETHCKNAVELGPTVFTLVG